MDFSQTPRLIAEVRRSVEDVWLFGSFARGRTDSNSDLDVLVVGSSESDARRVADDVGRNHRSAVDLSFYTRAGILLLCHPPSMFSWHLRLEGKCLYARSGFLARALERLQPYRSHLEDLRMNRALVEDVLQSTADASSVVLDAGVLATASRNAALILSHAQGSPDFASDSPVRAKTQRSCGFPLRPEHYRNLQRARCASERGAELDAYPEAQQIRDDAHSVLQWIDEIESYLRRRS